MTIPLQADPRPIPEHAGDLGRPAPSACPAAFAMELVAHKWTIHILFALHRNGGPVRFRRLQRETAPITQKELTKRLRELERSGLVHREAFAEVPPRVEYRLTDLGRTLMPALAGLHEWAQRHGAAVEENWRKAATSGPEA
ncbi:winged helix-turn-helix transcriptional regulator [Paludisphaera soli]|uniref:winged helix-turn-helix transcriptional regulator n=1 Tax=Paludisphaera soli TaxID=2712865 RepID=UPI00197FA9BD|nr:helix-turn-helix domain-containing protein [Paludisphaera soli]